MSPHTLFLFHKKHILNAWNSEWALSELYQNNCIPKYFLTQGLGPNSHEFLLLLRRPEQVNFHIHGEGTKAERGKAKGTHPTMGWQKIHSCLWALPQAISYKKYLKWDAGSQSCYRFESKSCVQQYISWQLPARANKAALERQISKTGKKYYVICSELTANILVIKTKFLLIQKDATKAQELHFLLLSRRIT